MNRAEFQRLAKARIADAACLLAGKRWSAAYDLCGYAVECALKACIVKNLRREPGIVFEERGSSSRCWTHNLRDLLDLAGLVEFMAEHEKARAPLAANWAIVLRWDETIRSGRRMRDEARDLFRAVTEPSDGSLTWLKTHW